MVYDTKDFMLGDIIFLYLDYIKLIEDSVECSNKLNILCPKNYLYCNIIIYTDACKLCLNLKNTR